MRKITSFMFLLMLCCIGAFAQSATQYKDKLIKVGTAQAKMEPNTWYFLHTPRNPNQNASDHVMPGEAVPSAGGLVTDKGANAGAGLTTTDVLTTMCNDDGINANNYMANLVRFVPVPDQDGAFYIEYGNGRFMADSPAKGSVSKNQQIAGQAGKYNFYLIKINGEPNQAGRFAWNVYNMKDRVDNNGAGNGVSLWSKDERVASEAESTPADGSNIKSNNVWQLYSIEVTGEVNLYESEVNNLLDTYTEITGREDGNYVSNLAEGINVGNFYGNYRPEDVQAFLTLNTEVEELAFEMDGGAGIQFVYDKFPNLEDLVAYHEKYKAADKKVRDNRIPLAVGDIKNGYYTVDNILRWVETVNDTIRYTQHECDSINEENGYNPGEQGFLTPDSVKEVNSNDVLANVKSLFSKNNDSGAPYLAWGEKKKSGAFLWKIEKVAGSETKYRMVNQFAGLTFKSIAGGANTPLIEDDTVAVYFDYRGKKLAPVPNDSVVVYSIRNTYNTAESGQNCYIHCGGHNNGKGKEGWTVGWAGSPEASLWCLTPISDEEAQEWMSSDADKLKKMLAEADKIMKSAAAQLVIAKDVLVTIHEDDSLVTDVAQFKGFETILDGTNTDPQDLHPAKGTADETLEYLLDGDNRTYWHTKWAGGNKPIHTHYLQVEATDPLVGDYAVMITRRAGAADDHAVKLAVRGYDTDDANQTFEQGVDLGVLNIPFTGKGKKDVSTNYFSGKDKRYIRFYWEASNGTVQRGYWHAAGFNVFRAEAGTVHTGNSQYKVREELAKALEAAMDKWVEGQYDATNPDLVKDEEFLAAYNALVEANKAWTAVYVDPTALRDAIKAAPAENIFVKGNNPGQWPAGAKTPTAVVDKAKAYDKACAYTPEESAKLIQEIQDATAEAFASANKVQTGKWYRFKFPTEEMYDTYGWSKDGPKAVENEDEGVETSPALFGKIAAAGKSVKAYQPYTNEEEEADTLVIFSTEAADELVEGNGIYFFSEEDAAQFENGEDLFQFIAANDTAFMIQNKATGLFLRGQHYVELSAVPTYYTTKALGAGANLVSFTDVLGGKPNAHVNLHGQRDDNRLVCWEASTLGSNSSIMIETVGDVTEQPAIAYTAKLWPGSVYTKVSPVDTKIIEGATAYGAELVLGAEDTTVVLKAIESEVIAAGTPYVLIADNEGDYISPADRKNEIIAEIIATAGKYGNEEKDQANEQLNDEYAPVKMEHGMKVDTIQRGLGDLVGTFRNITVAGGKALVAKENGFAHTLINTTVEANKAYLVCDFDPESEDVLGSIVIKIDGTVDTGIDNILNNVAKSGNIYTVDGKLVGKGNINTINRLPAGVYIVNGMKVVKK